MTTLDGRSPPASSVTPHAGWRELHHLGQQLLAEPTLDVQHALIVETATRLLGGQATLWLSDVLLRLPGSGKMRASAAEPPSPLMRRAVEMRRSCCDGPTQESPAAAIAVPISCRDSLLGVLQIQRPVGPAFRVEELDLAEGLADQSAIAFQITRQMTIERWRSEQLALVCTVSAQVANILDLDRLFEEVVTLIRECFNFPCVRLFTLDRGRRQIIYQAGSSPRGQMLRTQGLIYDLDAPSGIVPWVARHGEAVLANDVSRDPRYQPSELTPANTRAELAVPLTFGDTVLGVLDVQSDERDAFTSEDRALLTTLAHNLGIAIRNANLYRSELWRRQVAESMREVAGMLSNNLGLDQVLDTILTELERSLPCDVAAIWLLRDNHLCISAVHGYQAQACINMPSTSDNPWLRQALDAGLPLIRTPDSPTEPLGEALNFPPNYSAIAAPLRAGGTSLGLLCLVHHTPGRYGTESKNMTAAFASYAAVAIENTRLYQASQEQAWISTVMLQVAEATQALTSLEEIIERVVRLVPMLIGVGWCAVILRDDATGIFRPMAAYGLRPEQQALFHQAPLSPDDVPLLRHLLDTRAAVIATGSFPLASNAGPLNAPAASSEAHPDEAAGSPGFFHVETGYDAFVLLPLLVQGEVAGAMLVDHRQPPVTPGPSSISFSSADDWLAIAQGIANQTAAAIENAMLRQAQQEEAYTSTALLQVSQAVVGRSNLDDILSTIIRIMPALVGVERCAIFLWDEGQSVFRATHSYGIPRHREAAFLALRYAPGDFPLLDAVCESQRPASVLCPSPGEAGGGPERQVTDEFATAFAGHADAESSPILVIPLVVKTDVLGVMVVQESKRARGSSERRFEIIKGIAEQAAIAIQNDRLQQEMSHRERLEQELRLAREIQLSLVPGHVLDLEGWELAAICRPARQVGGDFYDLFDLPKNQLGLVIADVADKGMPAALFMALTRALMRAVASERTSPANVLGRVNALLLPDARDGMFVTAFYAIVSLETGTLTYANAGHNPPMILRSHTREVELLHTGGIALGVLEDVHLQEHHAFLAPGDYLVMYTDGATEAYSAENGSFYGLERLLATVAAGGYLSAPKLLEAIVQSVDSFSGTTPPFDDLTFVALRRYNKKAPAAAAPEAQDARPG